MSCSVLLPLLYLAVSCCPALRPLAAVRYAYSPQRTELYRRYRGELVGEMGLVSDVAWPGSCEAAVGVTALRVDRAAVAQLVAQDPDSTLRHVLDRAVAWSRRAAAGFSAMAP